MTLEIGGIEVRVHPVSRADGIVLYRVVGEARRGAIHMFLADHKRAAEQIDVGVGDILLGNEGGLRLRGCGYCGIHERKHRKGNLLHGSA